jgi:hypothetical protein
MWLQHELVESDAYLNKFMNAKIGYILEILCCTLAVCITTLTLLCVDRYVQADEMMHMNRNHALRICQSY